MFGSWIRIMLLGPVLALGLAVPAQADVDVTAAPTISGSAVVGAKLTANGGSWTGPWGTTVGRGWLQCPTATATEWSCDWLDGTNATTYTVRSADKDKWIRVALYAYKDSDYDYKVSGATAKIGAAPTPTPDPDAHEDPIADPDTGADADADADQDPGADADRDARARRPRSFPRSPRRRHRCPSPSRCRPRRPAGPP